jgi:Rieske Fe-S protein
MDQDVSQTQAQGILDAKAQAGDEGAPPLTPHDQVAPPMEDPGRRGFLRKAVAVLVGGFLMIVPATAGVLTFLSPVRRRGDRQGGSAGGQPFIRITSLGAVPDDGKPHRFPVIADRVDAWTIERNVPIGSIYLKRHGQKLIALNTRCPHLGCAVDSRGDGSFACPCHNSSFNPDGSLVPGSVSARGLDELEVDPVALAKGEVRVKYVEFETGHAEKIARA